MLGVIQTGRADVAWPDVDQSSIRAVDLVASLAGHHRPSCLAALQPILSADLRAAVSTDDDAPDLDLVRFPGHADEPSAALQAASRMACCRDHVSTRLVEPAAPEGQVGVDETAGSPLVPSRHDPYPARRCPRVVFGGSSGYEVRLDRHTRDLATGCLFAG